MSDDIPMQPEVIKDAVQVTPEGMSNDDIVDYHMSVIEAGGVMFKCTACGITGTVKPEHPVASAARKQHAKARLQNPNVGAIPVLLFEPPRGCPKCQPANFTS